MFTCFLLPDTATTEIYTLSLHDALPIFDTEVFQTITTDCHLKHPAVHQTTALVVLTMIRFLVNTTSAVVWWTRSEEHTSELQSQSNLVCRLLLEKKKNKNHKSII